MILSSRRSAGGAGLYISRQADAQAQEGAPIITIPYGEAFAIIVQLMDFKLHKLWHNGRLVHTGGHVKQSVAITDLTEDWRCQHLSPFDNIRLVITRQALDEFTFENGQQRIVRFDCAPGATDPVIFHLAQALAPLMDLAGGTHDFLIEHISLALFAHVTAVYAQTPQRQARRKGRLAPWQEQRAKEYMLENMSRGVSLEDIAGECRLSRAHFARYFKTTTGTSAYAWLQKKRIEKAQELLGRHEQTLTEIALECGFTDQSHFSRVFKYAMGTPPGNWQRMQVMGNAPGDGGRAAETIPPIGR